MVPNTTQISTFPHSDTNPNPDLTLELSLRDADNKLIATNKDMTMAKILRIIIYVSINLNKDR